MKAALVAPAVTVTEDGTETLVLLLVSATVLPPEGAAVLRVTVQVELPVPVIEEGVQLSELGTRTTGFTVTVVVLETPEALAVTVTDCVELGEPAVAENVTLEAPAGTVTDAGTVRKLLLLESETARLLEAGAERPTVQVALAPAARVLGLHDSEASAAATARFNEVLTEVPFKLAVI